MPGEQGGARGQTWDLGVSRFGLSSCFMSVAPISGIAANVVAQGLKLAEDLLSNRLLRGGIVTSLPRTIAPPAEETAAWARASGGPYPWPRDGE